jgi:predicted ATPase
MARPGCSPGEKLDPEASVLSVYNAEADYPENARVFEALKSIQVFTDPLFGRSSQLRKAKSTALPRGNIEEDGSNLALVLNRVLEASGMRRRFTDLVREIYPHVDVVETDTADNRIQVLFVEKGWKTPASRLSDGTLRWVFLLALLLDSENHNPIILAEPDLGLHPDGLRALADLLKEASERTQVIVATHNVTLIDHFTENQEAVVFENRELANASLHATQAKRLDPKVLPEKMLLGEAWQRGLIGGNRW